MLERGLKIDHSTIQRWVIAYAPELDKRCRPYLKRTNDSWRVDETYIKVRKEWKYLYRAVDSEGNTLDFMLSDKRDAEAAKRFLEKALKARHNRQPRVINVDKNPAYPPSTTELKESKKLRKKCKLRQVKYLNNIVEQDHRNIKRLVKPGMGFGSCKTAWKTIQGFESMNMIRKGQIKGVEKGDILGQISFINKIFEIPA